MIAQNAPGAKRRGEERIPLKISAPPGAKRFSAQGAVPAAAALMPNQSANAADFERDGAAVSPRNAQFSTRRFV
jgi:hypothetical protein